MLKFHFLKLFSELVCLSMSGPVGIVGFLQ